MRQRLSSNGLLGSNASRQSCSNIARRFSAIARMNSGGTEFPTLAHFSAKLPSSLNDSGKEDISLISVIVRCLTMYGCISPVVLLWGEDF